jgi:aryl-alcohol dehydrogenase-like predicted oxidoreductase
MARAVEAGKIGANGVSEWSARHVREAHAVHPEGAVQTEYSLWTRNVDDLAPDDFRRQTPRFQGDNFDKNLALVEHLTAVARQKGVTPAQLALAWVLSRGDDVIPIPGTRQRGRLEENVAAAGISFTADELAKIDAIAPRGVAAGMRYPEIVMNTVNR